MKQDGTNGGQPESVRRREDFDPQSGLWLERMLFNNRLAILVIFFLITLALGVQTTKVCVRAGFEKMIPTKHPYIVNYFAHKADLAGLANSVRIVVETTEGTIYNAAYLETLRQINDEVFFFPAVDRAAVKSLWMRGIRWLAVTEEGLDSGPVMPDTYDGSPESIEQLRTNVERSGEVGRLVSPNLKSSTIVLPLLATDPDTGRSLDYHMFSEKLEELRQKYEKGSSVRLHITGFAMIVGTLIAGLHKVLLFFVIAVTISAVILYFYTRCVRSTFLVVACSLIAVVWQLGFMVTFGFDLDPYGILVPFLVFAIGMSHGSQKMNGIMMDIGRGSHRLAAARFTFRRLFLPGLTALLSDAVGFGVLAIIDIPVIRDLAITATIGVVVLIFTNLILIPLSLSFIGVSAKAAAHSVRKEMAEQTGEVRRVWSFLGLFTQREGATVAVVTCAVLGVVGFNISRNVRIGDFDPGAPELRPDSRYNQDNAFTVANYGASSDLLVVMIKTPEYGATNYKALLAVDALDYQLREMPGVRATRSLARSCRFIITGLSEGSLKWYELIPNSSLLNKVLSNASRELFNYSCDLQFMFVYLEDHKAETLTRVVEKVEEFAAENNTDELKFMLAAGNAGIEAATNIVVGKAMREMLFWVYGAVILLCFITFRSWRAVVAAIVPLVLTSVLCEVLMVWLGIGVKVATLPVIALGVGVGVDYALYVLSVVLNRMREGMNLYDAYQAALRFTGKVVVLIGLTLSIGVGTWILSPIKFQGDMGILLAFMFLWNMVGALILMPALLYFLLPVRMEKSPVR